MANSGKRERKMPMRGSHLGGRISESGRGNPLELQGEEVAAHYPSVLHKKEGGSMKQDVLVPSLHTSFALLLSSPFALSSSFCSCCSSIWCFAPGARETL